jgi:branched-chain amino acid transport system substrate-binding protein
MGCTEFRTSPRRVATMVAFAILVFAAFTPSAFAQKNYGPGVSDTEIKIGQTIAYSGPASFFGTIGRTVAGYYRMVNEQGGINGRKINFISLDDAYSPPKTVEQTRRLVEQDQVLAIIGSLGTPTNASVQRYLNERNVPQLLLFTGASRFREPQTYPWTTGTDLSYADASRAYAQHIVKTAPGGKIAVLYQNDDFGKDHLGSFRAALGDNAKMIVKEVSYEVSDATVDSQIIDLQATGADILFTIAIPKFTAQAIRKAHDIGWKPLHIITFPAASVTATLQPAGLENSIGVVSVAFYKEPGDVAWANDSEVLKFLAFLKKYNPDANPNDSLNVIAYVHAATVVAVLRLCGDDLTRKNLLYEATHMRTIRVPMLLPGSTMNTSPTEYSPVKQMQLQRFDGTRWVAFGGVVGE